MKTIDKKENDWFGLCPYITAQKLIAGKWAVVVLHYLDEKTMRFGELQRKIPQVSQATLTKQLRDLEEHGLVHREVYPEVPPRVEYSLTETGKLFRPVLDAVETFGSNYIEHIKDTAAI